MTVNTTWVAPTGATLDLANGVLVNETNWDALVSDVYRLGGTDGNAKTGPLEIGATTYSNTKNTAGLTIQQGTADDEIVSLKSSDVVHGMTDLAETDTFATLGKFSGAGGGLLMIGYDDGGGNAWGGMYLQGVLGQAANATKSTGSYGVVIVDAVVKSGTTRAAVGANGNLVSFGTNNTTRFLLDSDGDSHQDVGTAWTNFDAHDDAALLNALAHEVARPDDPVKDEFRSWLTYNRADLERARLVTFNPDGHHFVNMSRLTMVLVGAARQQAARLAALETRLLAA